MKLHLPPRLIRVLIALVSGFPIIASIADASMSESVTNDLFISVGGNTTNSSISGYDNVVADGIVDGDFILSSSDPVIIDRNGKVLFAGNLASCIRLVSTNLEIADNGEVVFEDNNAGLNGVIDMYHYAFDVSIIDNKLVRFSRNEGQRSTICYADEIIATSNDELIFEDNSCVSPGGCLSADNLVELSNNDNISFLRNSTDSKGGAIALVDRWTGELYGEVLGRSRSLMKDNGAISFVENTAKDDGGAMCASLIEIMDNSGLVLFSDNSAACGGAMNAREVTISGNSTGVDFCGNKAGDSGGAIYIERMQGMEYADIIISNNGAVRFSENSAAAYGGAICMREFGSIITMSDNTNLIFSGNSASYGGGAISVRIDNANLIKIRSNGSVVFSDNRVSSLSSSGGGAIEGTYIELVDNGSVSFSGNGASGVDSASGGAIWCTGGLDICNNDSVEFFQNFVNIEGVYRLQSINSSYRYNFSSVAFSVSAEKNITFRDSIYIPGGILELNADYTDAEENIIEQKGDIIFTGKTTEDDLYIVKGNVAGTVEEIQNSRTTEVKTVANLYNGRLIIKEEAIWSGDGITVAPEEGTTYNPSLLLQNAHLTHYAPSDSARNVVTIKSGAALEVAGKNTASYTSMIFEGGSTLTFNLSSSNTSADTAVLCMRDSSLTLPQRGNVTLKLTVLDGIANRQSYALLTGVSQPNNWNSTNITVISGTAGWEVDYTDLAWVGDTLWVYYDGNILPPAEPMPEPEPKPEPEFAPELNRNQQIVYDAMKEIMGEGKTSGLLGQLGKEVTDTRDEARLKELLDALGGAEYATLMSSQQDATRGHMRRLRGSMGSGHALAGTETRAYIEAYTNRSDVDGDTSGRGYEMTENGGQFALEFLGEEKVSGGLAVASGRTKLQPDGGLSQKGSNTYVDAFLVHRDGGYTGKTSLGVGVHSYDLERQVMGYAAIAQTDGSSVNFMHESAYEVAVDEVNSVQFFGALESSMGKLDAFLEKGAGTASLQVESQDAWMTTLSAGARYHYRFAAVETAPAATLSLQAGLEYKLGDTESEVEMNFSGAGSHSFRQSGSKRDSFGYNVGASLHMPVSARAAIYASGDAVLRGDSREVNANVGIQLAF